MGARPDLLPLHEHILCSGHGHRAPPNFDLLQCNHNHSRSSSHTGQPLKQTLAHLHMKLCGVMHSVLEELHAFMWQLSTRV